MSVKQGKTFKSTISGVFENVIHASINPEEAEREIKLWFDPDEIVIDLYPTNEIKLNNCKGKVWK